MAFAATILATWHKSRNALYYIYLHTNMMYLLALYIFLFVQVCLLSQTTHEALVMRSIMRLKDNLLYEGCTKKYIKEKTLVSPHK